MGTNNEQDKEASLSRKLDSIDLLKFINKKIWSQDISGDIYRSYSLVAKMYIL